jgi:hypothetical protein
MHRSTQLSRVFFAFVRASQAALLQAARGYASKDVRFGIECREAVLAGVNKLADAVQVTLGPKVRSHFGSRDRLQQGVIRGAGGQQQLCGRPAPAAQAVADPTSRPHQQACSRLCPRALCACSQAQPLCVFAVQAHQHSRNLPSAGDAAQSPKQQAQQRSAHHM